MLCPRRNTEVSSASSYSVASRINPNIQNYWWRVGSLIIPQKYVNVQNSANTGGYAEAFAEIQKSFHALNHSEYSGSIGSILYQVCDLSDNTVGGGVSDGTSAVLAPNTGANSYLNAFSLSAELESFAQRNDTILSGLNCLGSQIFWEANLNSTATAAAYTLDFFAYYDMILILSDGLLSVKF